MKNNKMLAKVTIMAILMLLFNYTRFAEVTDTTTEEEFKFEVVVSLL